MKIKVVMPEGIEDSLSKIKINSDNKLGKYRVRYIILFIFSVFFSVLAVATFLVNFYTKAYSSALGMLNDMLIVMVFLVFIGLNDGFKGLKIAKELKVLREIGYDFKKTDCYSAYDDKFSFLTSSLSASGILNHVYEGYEILYNIVSSLKYLSNNELVSIDATSQTGHSLPLTFRVEGVSGISYLKGVVLTANDIHIHHSSDVCSECTFQLDNQGVLSITVPRKQETEEWHFETLGYINNPKTLNDWL